MERKNRFIAVTIFFISIPHNVFSQAENCTCNEIIIQKKHGTRKKINLQWYSNGAHGTTYKTKLGQDYLAKDANGHWEMGRIFDASEMKYWTSDTSPCPIPGDQTWNLPTTMVKNNESPLTFNVQCKGYRGYLSKNQKLICKDSTRLTATSFYAAINYCNENKACKAVHQHPTSHTYFYSCKGTKKHGSNNGIFYVKGYKGYRIKSGNLWCDNLYSLGTKVDNVPTAIHKCNQNDDCVGVKDIDGQAEEVLLCKSLIKNIEASKKGTTYQRKCVTKEKEKCQFPFTQKNKRYSSCTSDPHRKLMGVGFWCATSRYKLSARSVGEGAGWCKHGDDSYEEISNLDTVQANSPQDANMTIPNNDDIMDAYGGYIYAGGASLIVLIASAAVMSYYSKMKCKKEEMKSPDDDIKYEDDGYDYIGQLEMIPPNIGNVALSVNQNEDPNTTVI